MLAAKLMPEAPPLMRISCDLYHTMIASGLLTPEHRVELIDGYLVTKKSIAPNHGATVNRLNWLLSRRLGDEVIVTVQNPITIHDYSEPEPDIVVAKFRDDFYAKQHPYPEDVLLVIEVADSSLAYDRDAKIPLYAAAGIPEVWLVDLAQSQVHVFRRPEGAVFTEQRSHKVGDTLRVPGVADVPISVSELGFKV